VALWEGAPQVDTHQVICQITAQIRILTATKGRPVCIHDCPQERPPLLWDLRFWVGQDGQFA
jgi:hypothetical protein